MNYRIKEIRIDRDFKHKDLAKVLNISQSTYSDLENEISYARADYLIKLSEFYNVSVDYLLGLTDCMKPYPRSIKQR